MSGDVVTYEDLAHRLMLAWWWRGSTGHPLAAVRAGLADYLEHGDMEALTEALKAVYGDEDAVRRCHLDAVERGWLASDDPVLREVGALLRDTRHTLWNSSLDELD